MNGHPYECPATCAECAWDEVEADGVEELVCEGCGDDVDRYSAYLHKRCHMIDD